MDKKISALDAVQSLQDTDVLPIVNGNQTRKVSISQIKSSLATITIDAIPTDASPNAVSSNGVFDALALKVDKIAGKGLSTNDYTTLEQTKLTGIQAGAEVNVNADWNATSGDAQILNKPTIPSAQVNSDWNATSGVSQILNKPAIPTQTSNLTNNGADGTNPFITALDIPTAGQAGTLVREVKNMTGATLTKGTVVYISGANGNKPLVSKALATTDALSARTFGLLQSNILNNGLGYCVIIGDLTGLNTSSFTEGDQLYLSGVTAGTYTASKILAPTHLVYVGKVTRSHPTLGQIEIGIQNGYELDEIHDVAISTPINDQVLSYDNATSLWKNKSVTTADIAASTNKNYVTDAQVTVIGNTSGTNTGDETTSTIKTKLGITTLSGNNTGDQDLSGYVPTARTVNAKPLSANVVLTTADVADSTGKRYQTENQNTYNDATSSIQTQINSKIGVTQVTPVTLTTGGWTLVSGLYNYVYSNGAITSASIVDVIPSSASITVVKAADIMPSTLSATGTVTLYATNLPTGSIIVTFNIFK